METLEPIPDLNTSLTSNSKKIIRKYFNWAIVNHLIAMLVAVILSLAAAGVALYVICDAYIKEIDHPVWADITMSLLLGVWVSGKPKFFNRKKVEKD